MNKTISISLGGTIFNVDEAAYEKLKNYLDSIKNHFADDAGCEDIINDIEMRAAEEFATKISTAKQVIAQSDVDDLIRTMGTVADITEGTSQEIPKTDNPKESKNRRLYRDSDDVVIAGVCSGIAAYFGIDPVIVRILFVLSIFMAGSSIFFYIILWIIMPEAKTTTEKMQMRGEPITISSLEDAVKKKFKSYPGEQNRLLKAVAVPFRFIGQIFSLIGRLAKKIVPIFSVLFGLIASILFLAGFGFIMFVFSNLLFNADSPYIDFPIKSIIAAPEYYILSSAGLMIILVPLIFVLMAGISLIRRKSAFNLLASLSLILLWIMAIVATGVFLIKSAPRIESWKDKKTNAIIDQPIEGLANFDKISVRGDYKITIEKSASTSVIVRGQKEKIEQTKFEIVDGVLKIKPADRRKICILCSDNFFQPLEIKISAPSITSYASGGNANAIFSGFEENMMNIDLYNGSELEASFSASTTKLNIENSSSAKLMGHGSRLIGEIENSADFDGDNFMVKTVEIDIMDFGTAKLNATDEIIYSADKMSKIYYQGTPTISRKKSIDPKAVRIESDDSDDNKEDYIERE